MILEGKVALVTGSTSGIGLAIARAFAAEGAKVMLNGFGDPAEIETAEGRAWAQSHDGADLSDPAQIEAMIRHCTDELGAPDILVNNAGIQHVSPVESFPAEKWDAILRDQPVRGIPHDAPDAAGDEGEEAGAGSSTPRRAHSLVASPNKSAYVAAKHGVAGFTKTVALEAARDGVTVNCISPGYVWTTAGREPDPRHDEGARPDPRAGDERRPARRPADQALRHARGSGQPRALPVPRRRGVDHRRNLSMDGGWTAA